MTGKTHMAIGTAVTAGILIQADAKSAVLMIGAMAGSMVGSLFPDIDTPQSTIGRKCLPVSVILNHMLGHRGVLHSPFFAGAAGVMCYLLAVKIPVALITFFLQGMMIGWVMHLAADFLTKQGLPIFYPLSKKHYGIGIVTTGGILDYAVRVFSILYFVYSLLIIIW